MKQLLFIILILTVQVFSETNLIYLYCIENGVNQQCTQRKYLDLSEFDSDISQFNANMYSYNESQVGVRAIFWDDATYKLDYNSSTKTLTTVKDWQKFNIINYTFSSGLKYQSAYYKNIDMVDTATSTRFNTMGNIIFKLYVLNEKEIQITNGDQFSIVLNDNASSIQFGTPQSECSLQQSTIFNSSTNEYNYTLQFKTCPVIINAIDPETENVYQYTADFNEFVFQFSKEKDESFDEVAQTERLLYNIEGQPIGYLQFNFFTESFRVLDLNKQPFNETIDSDDQVIIPSN